MVWCPARKLYVEDVVPETGTMLFTSNHKKARPYFKVDATLILGYVKDSTGMEFELQQI
jgi:hypothetical protein